MENDQEKDGEVGDPMICERRMRRRGQGSISNLKVDSEHCSRTKTVEQASPRGTKVGDRAMYDQFRRAYGFHSVRHQRAPNAGADDCFR